jgi:hypothetical protein
MSDKNRSSPDPKRPRLNAPIPGPAPYVVPPSHTNISSQVMGPPPIRLQTGLYPAQSQTSVVPIRPIISTNPTLSMPPPPAVEDRPQDAEQLQDALASAGVDLKAEEFNLSQIMTPSSATPTQPQPFIVPPTYGALQAQQQVDENKLIFNRLVLSRLVSDIGIKSL